MNRLVFALALALAALTGCDRRAKTSLDDIQRKLETVVGHTPLGDFGSVAWEAPAQADWLVFMPAGATGAAFPDSAFMKSVGTPPAGLLGLAESSIAFVNGGKVAEIQSLNPAFTVDKLLAKPGRTANGLRFVRKMGARRSYQILSLD